MGLHGRRRDVQPLRDLGVRPAGGDRGDHVALPPGERAQPVRLLGCADGAPAADGVDEFAGQTGGDDHVAGGHGVHGRGQFVGRGVREDESAAPARSAA
ncbi:hypothetical protein SALBM311S_02754 [Streptomyces alboniger]